MTKNTFILLGERFENIINEQDKSGRLSSVSVVVRSALRLFEQEENKTKILVNELKAGERSGIISHFNKDEFLSTLHNKYLKNER